jgi:diacylglycerol O-acyltransferase
MRQHPDNNRLSTGDALFLYLEREGMPLNVASISIFEGNISRQLCSRFIESKLPLIPRYRQRLRKSPFNIGIPEWEFDPEFDIRNHVREVSLRDGTEAELKSVAGKILSTVMDRHHPLWDFTVVHGLEHNCTAIITRIHHCLADGLAGVDLLNTIMDSTPEVRPLPKKRTTFPISSPKKGTLLDELVGSSVALAERALNAQVGLFNVFQRILMAAVHANGNSNGNHLDEKPLASLPSADQLARLMPEVTAATQRLPFNVICRGPQSFAWSEIPLADLKAVKNACGVTINDVALTIMAATIRCYSVLRGVNPKGRLLRIVIPVSVRTNGHAHDLGNQITFLPVTLPLEISKPLKWLAAIRERIAFLKGAHLAECVSIFGTMLGTIPTAAQELMGRIVSQIPLGLCNLIFTNVPGPEAPLYLHGHKMLRCYPYVPIGGDIGINCAMLTYNGTAYFGFTGDVHAAPDLRRLEKLLKASFSELKQAAGVSKRRISPGHKPTVTHAQTSKKNPAKMRTDPKAFETVGNIDPEEQSEREVHPRVAIGA